MSFIPLPFPRAARALWPASSQYRCLFTPATVNNVRQRNLSANSRQFSQRRSFHASPASQSTKNPYEVLGVDKSASTSEIKKSYYTAAKKYHPDSSKEPNAREKFQEVQAAYEVLSDPEKKAHFDQFGESGFDPSGGPGGFHPGAGSGAGTGGFSGFGGGPFGAEFSFEDLFSAFGGGAGGKRGGRRRNPFTPEVLVGEDIEVQTSISFVEAAKGVHRDVRISPLVNCKTCAGSGMKADTKKRECGRCGGTGTRVHFMQGGFQMAATCEACGGNGVVIPPGSECNTCHGNGVMHDSRTVGVDIPAGIDSGMRLRISGEGDAPSMASSDSNVRTQRGDLFVHIQVEPHPKFGRKGSDVTYTATIPMTTALLGGVIKIPTLDGEVELRVPTGTNTSDRIVMSGMGMKKLNSGRRGGAGDLRVEFKVNMPKSLTVSQRTLLELLADEFRDNTAKRVLNVGQFAKESAQKPNDEEKRDS